jgi:hypothetical protein
MGGSTLIFDLDAAEVELRYAISKRLMRPNPAGARKLNFDWIDQQHLFRTRDLPLCMPLVAQYFGSGTDPYLDEPFAMLHQQ